MKWLVVIYVFILFSVLLIAGRQSNVDAFFSIFTDKPAIQEDELQRLNGQL